MIIRKIANLSEEEILKIKTAGHLVSEIASAFESNEVTELSDDTTKLLAALQEITKKVLDKTMLVEKADN